ncbi:hypothetical protein KYY02_01810 [Streptomyces pimonensis]|uniref:Uncharacterized protein n=1 Tax=Streptomyces pimonensis TaxID=2860288 RepID=A0ABV4IW54_9ACTN
MGAGGGARAGTGRGVCAGTGRGVCAARMRTSSDPAAVLEAVESEFGLAVDPREVAGPLPTVVVPVRAG